MSFPDLSTHNFECYKSYELAPSDLPKLLTIPPERPWSLELSFKGSPESVYPPIEGELIVWLFRHSMLSLLKSGKLSNSYELKFTNCYAPGEERHRLTKQEMEEFLSIYLDMLNISEVNKNSYCSVSFMQTVQEEFDRWKKTLRDLLYSQINYEDILMHDYKNFQRRFPGVRL